MAGALQRIEKEPGEGGNLPDNPRLACGVMRVKGQEEVQS